MTKAPGILRDPMKLLTTCNTMTVTFETTPTNAGLYNWGYRDLGDTGFTGNYCNY